MTASQEPESTLTDPLIRAAANDSELSDFSRQSSEWSNGARNTRDTLSDVEMDGWVVDRDGSPQTIRDYPENSKIARPDDTIHAELRTSQDVILLLSDPATEHHSAEFRGSCWKGQLNGRNQFKVVCPSEDYQRCAPRMRLCVYIDSWVRSLDFKTDMRHAILSLSGHLAIEIHRNQPLKVALMLPPNMPVTSDFRIVIGLTAEPDSGASISATACKESFLTLSDCALPMQFTTKYPVRPRKLSARARSYGSAGNGAESLDSS